MRFGRRASMDPLQFLSHPHLCCLQFAGWPGARMVVEDPTFEVRNSFEWKTVTIWFKTSIPLIFITYLIPSYIKSNKSTDPFSLGGGFLYSTNKLTRYVWIINIYLGLMRWVPPVGSTSLAPVRRHHPLPGIHESVVNEIRTLSARHPKLHARHI